MVLAYIGLGSNLDEPLRQIHRAKQALSDLDETSLTSFSSIYSSKPLDGTTQPHYLNAVAKLETTQPPLTLLQALQNIENQQLRERTVHWGPRTLDLDLLLYGQEQIELPDLHVPHPGIPRRDFVLWPLHELASDLNIPGMGAIQSLLDALPDNGIRKL